MAVEPELAVMAALAEAKNITRDQHCVNCGYNLRTLAVAGQCPECGTPVIHSLHNNELRFSNPEWVGTLHFGIKLMLWMIPLSIFAGIVGAMSGNAAIQLLLVVAAQILSVWAVWQFTMPEPRPAVSVGEERIRKILRFFVVVNLAAGLVNLLGQTTQAYKVMILAALASLVSVPYYWVLLLYFRRLALRIPNPRLAKSASIVMWGMSVSMVLMMVGGFLAVFYMGTRLAAIMATATASAPTAVAPPAPPAFPIFTGCLAGLAGVAALVFAVWFLILMFRMNRALGEAAKYAALNIPKINPPGGP